MPKLVLECELCDFKVDQYGSKWRKHLLSDGHQNATRIKNTTLSEADNKRSCVVFGIHRLRMEDVLKFLSEKSVVTEFIFWKETPDICLVEFALSRSAVQGIASELNSILGNEVVVRVRNSITDLEWRSICPLVSACVKNESSNQLNNSTEDATFTLSKVKMEPTENLRNKRHTPSNGNPVLPQPINSDPEIPRKLLKLEVAVEEPKSHSHSLTLTASRSFLSEAGRVESCESGSKFDAHLNSLWSALVHEFNLLVWDKLFGIQLYELNRPAESSDAEFTADGSLIRGILKNYTKIESWAQTREESAELPKAMETYKRIYVKCLRNNLNAVPLKLFDEKAESEWKRRSGFLSFDLQVVRSGSGSTESEAPVSCHLQFTNIVTSETVDFNQFKDVVGMYHELWGEFSWMKLRRSFTL